MVCGKDSIPLNLLEPIFVLIQMSLKKENTEASVCWLRFIFLYKDHFGHVFFLKKYEKAQKIITEK